MIKIVNPMISLVDAQNPQGGYRFTASFIDGDTRGNEAAWAIRKILEKMPNVDDDLIDIRFNEPISFSGNERVKSECGVESITYLSSTNETLNRYPHGHVEIVTKQPVALHALLLKSMGSEINDQEQDKLQSVINAIPGRSE